MQTLKAKNKLLLSLIIIISLALFLSSCSPESDENPTANATPGLTGDDLPRVNLCDLTAEMVGKSIQVEGQITYLDISPEGVYFDVQVEECQAGVWLDRDIYDALSVEQQELLVMNGSISVGGIYEIEEGENLLKFISLGKPTGSTADTARDTQDQDMEGNETDYDLVDLCELNAAMAGNPVRVEGRISFLDSSPEGVYFDLRVVDCQVGVWLDADLYDDLSEEQQELLVMDGKISVSGSYLIEEGENFLDFISLAKPTGFAVVTLDPSEQWWLKPQTYHNGEGPDLDLISEMNITVLHDWGSLTAGFAPDPDPYWTEEAIKERWNRAHAKGMRVEAVLSIIDMWFVEYGPGDEVYQASGINLYGDHIEYDDPVGFVGCTNLHSWQDFTRYKIFKAIDWGVDGIIIDDYEGSSRWTSGVTSGMGGSENGPGGCFCSACEAGFRQYLKEQYTSAELERFEIFDIDEFDYSEYLLERGWTIEDLGAESRKFQGWSSGEEIIIPLYQDYADFQNLEIVNFLANLREEAISYAREEYGREISWSENAGELTYGAHKSYPLFDRNVGAIWQFGYPPKGTEGYHYRLGFSIYGLPRLREVFRDPVVVAVMNEYQTQDLWLIKAAEAYANLGALIEYDYITIEGASDQVALASLTNDPEAKNRYNTFYLDNPEVFSFTSLESLARTAVLYSSASVHYDMNRHIQSFNGISEILTDLNVQFDPLYIGDGLSYPDSLSSNELSQYELVYLPNVYALTTNQAEALLDFMENGGTVIALGNFAVVDEHGLTFNHNDMSALTGRKEVQVGLGLFSQYRTESFRAGGIYEDYFKDMASIYFERYIENNHPAVETLMSSLSEEPQARISEDTAAEIKDEISKQVENALSSRFVIDIAEKDIALQAYLQNDSDQLIIHLLNYNYDLETDTVFDQADLGLEIQLLEGFQVSRIRLLSPDMEEVIDLEFSAENGLLRLTIPELHIWDVLVLE